MPTIGKMKLRIPAVFFTSFLCMLFHILHALVPGINAFAVPTQASKLVTATGTLSISGYTPFGNLSQISLWDISDHYIVTASYLTTTVNVEPSTYTLPPASPTVTREAITSPPNSKTVPPPFYRPNWNEGTRSSGPRFGMVLIAALLSYFLVTLFS